MKELTFMLAVALLLVAGESVSPGATSDADERASHASTSGPARIVFEHPDNVLRVQGVFESPKRLASRSLSYSLTIERHGKSGSARTLQQGSFEPDPGSVDTLATVRVTARPSDDVSVDLTVRDGAERIAETHREWSSRE